MQKCLLYAGIVKRGKSLRQRLRRVLPLYAPPSRCAESGASVGIAQQGNQGGGERGRIVGRNEQARFVFDHRFGQAADPTGDDWLSRRHRFERRDSLSLLTRRNSNDIRDLQIGYNFWSETCKMDRGIAPRHFLQPVALRPVPNYNQTRRWNFRLYERKSEKQDIETFFRREPADCND